LSKDRPSWLKLQGEGQGFDKLSPNGGGASASTHSLVIPANAGLQNPAELPLRPWIPAFAGMTEGVVVSPGPER
jgi:hypothetical protein